MLDGLRRCLQPEKTWKRNVDIEGDDGPKKTGPEVPDLAGAEMAGAVAANAVAETANGGGQSDDGYQDYSLEQDLDKAVSEKMHARVRT